ncbi:ABC-2 transporter permease [Neobacillus sp. SCS-31]|uniref:ABC-2 transporter permease n=1 Tax=Neobacillus oceani TaxID=3115292 RepID=UPI003905C5C5
MVQLMIKDLYIQKKSAYFAPLLLLTFFLSKQKEVGMGNASIENVTFGLSVGFIAYFMTMYSNFNTGESERLQNRLILSLPISRLEVIRAKYLMIAVWWVISYVTYFIIIVAIKYVFNLLPQLSIGLHGTLLSFCFAYLLSSVFYPIHFKFGYRTSSLVGILLFFLITSSLGKFLGMNSGLSIILQNHPIFSIAIVSLAVSSLSYFLSGKIFAKTEF